MSLDRLDARGREIGAARVDAVRGRIVTAVEHAVPEARVALSGDDVIVTGRGLMPALRWIGSLIG